MPGMERQNMSTDIVDGEVPADAGYIFDYISGVRVKATPEEVEAVQVFSKQLVEDYNYPKEYLQTRPQFRVKVRPSDTAKSYPVDIAIFSDESKSDESLYIVIECKKKSRKDGKTQLEDYLRLSRAQLGVWFNGNERLFLRKIELEGRVDFEEIPNIPKFGQRLEDVGLYKRADLRPTHNLKATFRAIRNHLAANTVGATRDEKLAQELINIIFCKLYDERFSEPDDIVNFRAGVGESRDEVRNRILSIFDKVKRKYKEVIEETDTISLDAHSIAYVVGELQNYCLIEAERDIIADAFESFIGPALKGEQGQFFTPRNVVKMMVEIIDPSDEDSIIDPACGSGGFLIESLRYIWRKLDTEGEKFHWNKTNLQEEKMQVALNNLKGIDKDFVLARVAKAYMAIVGDGKSGIFIEDSLDKPENWSVQTRSKIHLNSFSVCLTNPPFGSKIPVRGEEKLSQYKLGKKWKIDKSTGEWSLGSLKEKEAPQILFIERCLQLLRPGGRMGLVLPDGTIGNRQLNYLRDYILGEARLVAVIDVPIETFMPNTSTKTSILFLEKSKSNEDDYPIFMAVCETCGHDRRGKETDGDDIADVPSRFRAWCKEVGFEFGKSNGD
jgi:type I restriction enzyme M protein